MKHWYNERGWEMANSMWKKVFKRTQNFVATWRFLSLSANEVINIDNQY
jgi:hypothetical protein